MPRVLVAEDDDAVRDVLRTILERTQQLGVCKYEQTFTLKLP
jgi:CheY-like chemotaxis protein